MAKHLSPGAQLLRTSRLFSVPSPLPKPTQHFDTLSNYRDSDTSTTHYPTHQAIATLPSSRSRGDWGLKRPLPSRLVEKSSNPTVRVTGIDTVEHVTFYASAGDHVKTLEKFQELGVALSRREARDSFYSKPLSAFESAHDKTTKDASEADLHSSATRLLRRNAPTRWKFSGPSVARLSEGEFKRFLKRELRGKKQAFMEFLRPRLWRRYLEHESRLAREHAEKASGTRAAEKLVEARFYQLIANMDENAFERFKTKDVSDETVQSELQSFIESQSPANVSDLSTYSQNFEQQFRQNHEKSFADYMRSWLVNERYDQTTNSNLNVLIREFLDMPLNASLTSRDLSSRGLPDPEPFSFTTHPSAGLGYLRTNSVLPNHPLLGPQAERPPVEARVLQPRNIDKKAAILGVAGIATPEKIMVSGLAQYNDPNVAELDIHSAGGKKVWVAVDDAYIDTDGKVRLAVSHAASSAVNVRSNTVPTDSAPAQRSTRPQPFSPSELADFSAGFRFDRPLASPDAAPQRREVDPALARIREVNRQNEKRFSSQKGE